MAEHPELKLWGMHDTHLMTLNELARRLRVPTRWLRQEAEAGRLPHLKAGRQMLFNWADVERRLAERAARVPGEADDASR